jgi:hypothetical protein
VLQGKVDDRREPAFGEAPKEPEAVGPAAATPTNAPGAGSDPILYADAGDRADLQNTGEAIQPLAELCALREAQTPFLAAIVGPSGVGKSFALRRVAEAAEELTAAAARAPSSPFLSRLVVARVDAATISGDPAGAIASAAFAALERGRDGVNYAALADEAAHAGADPQRAAAAAADRHDEIGKRLESERAARDDVEAKRARLTEALLYETPGSRVDAFIRASRPAIEARLRRFDLADGEATANYRDLVRDLDAVGAASRASVAVRSIWAYRSQTRLLTAAAVALVIAFGLSQLRGAPTIAAVRGAASFLAPAADWLTAHDDLLATGADVFVVLALLALLLTVWRAFGFSALLFRGFRLLNQDLKERRRELDASSARLNQRVAQLTAEAEAAAEHAATTAKRAGGAKPGARAPGPVFARGPEAPAAAARSFFVELGRLMSAGGASAPERLVFTFDNLDALAPADALRLIAAADATLGPGCVGVVACDPAVLASGGETARQRISKYFQVGLNAATFGLSDQGRFAARLIGSNAVVNPIVRVDASQSRLIEPLSQGEAALLTALAPLAADTPRGVKRFLNAYRLARLSPAPRPAVALMLAVRQSGDAAAIRAMRAALASEAADLPDPVGSPALAEATRAARAATDGTVSLSDARSAFEAVERYVLAD